jgi:hypothetical protein
MNPSGQLGDRGFLGDLSERAVGLIPENGGEGEDVHRQFGVKRRLL